MKAKLLTSLRIKGKRVSVSEGKTTIVDLEQDEFDRLAALGAVAKPSKDELLLAGAAEPAPAPKRASKAAETKTEGGAPAKGAKAAETKTEGGAPADGEL